MRRYHTYALTLAAAVFCCLVFGGTQARADTQAELDAALKKIDMKLYEQSEADIRAWLDKMIEIYGDFGIMNALGDGRIDGDTLTVHGKYGGAAPPAAEFLRAYEILGDRKYLRFGLKGADFYLQIQQPAGHFPMAATVKRGGKAAAQGQTDIARIQDRFQFYPFSLLLYAYKLSGQKKYLDGARRCAGLFATHIQSPKYGWCGDQYNVRTMQPKPHYDSDGGSYNDFATTDPMRMTIMMYHLTKDKKYLRRTGKIGQWMFDTQLGKGKVRGWCQQYTRRNKPASARNFEMPVIGPRVFDRATGPMLIWFYGMTGDESYYTLLKETHDWMKSVEHPDDHPLGGGWAYQYLRDGTEVFSVGYKIYRYDNPQHVAMGKEKLFKGARPFNRAKVNLHGEYDLIKPVIEAKEKGGLKAVRAYFSGPTKYNPRQYLEARLAAARRCTDKNLRLKLPGGPPRTLEEATGNYLNRVAQRWMRPDAAGMPKKHRGATGMLRQTWCDVGRPLGWAQWQYVHDVRLATGKIDPDTAAVGGRGLLVFRYVQPWDYWCDWTTRAVEVENWMDVPLAQFE